MKHKHKMKHYSRTMLLICLLAGFGIFLGVDVANRGIERIQGPFQGTVSNPVLAQGKRAEAEAALSAEAGKNRAISVIANSPGQSDAKLKAQQAAAAVHPVLEDSIVNRLSNKIGEALRLLAQMILQSITSMLQSIFA